MANTDLVKLAVDHYRGQCTEFSKDESENIIKNALSDLMCGADGKVDYRKFRRNKIEVFEAMEDILQTLITEGIENQFNEFVDYRNLAFGDKNYFMVDDYRLFPIATISAGNSNLRRQRLDRNSFEVPTEWKGVKIYDELERFLANRVDWNKMVDKVQLSFQTQIATDIYNALTVGYNALAAPYKATGSWDRVAMLNLVQHVKAATKRNVTVFGTLVALQNATPFMVAYNGSAIEQRNALGFYRVIDGVTYQEIEQAHTPGTDNFAIGDNFLLVVPQGEEKIIKLVDEGTPQITETSMQQTTNADKSIEYTFEKKYGVGVITTTRYAAYVMS
jgi:hypothetical protein